MAQKGLLYNDDDNEDEEEYEEEKDECIFSVLN
jgi:hypothetical protein